MKIKAKKKINLSNCTFDELCKLPYDNFSSGTFTIMTDSNLVWLTMRGQTFELPRHVFNELITGYLKEQSEKGDDLR